jgi:hypothetical protein
MAAILFMLGVVLAVAGLVTLGFGISINEFTLGTTLIIAGTTALTGGLILLGLSAAVTELGRIAEGLRHRAARPAARLSESAEPASPPAPAVAPAATAMAMAAAASRVPQPNMPLPPRPLPDMPPREAARAAEPYPAAPSAVEVSAAAIERLRSSIPRTERFRGNPPGGAETEGVPLSPNGTHGMGVQHQPREPRNEAVETTSSEGRSASEDRSGGAAVEALKASRLDFLFRSRPARPQAQPESPETLWPAEASESTPAPSAPQSRVDHIERRAGGVAAEPRQESAAPDGPRSPAILKSGVVDGMAYTLYADGSIEAKLPHGTVRFGSIAELRAHIESNS